MRINKYKPIKYENSLALVKEFGVNYQSDIRRSEDVSRMLWELFLQDAVEEYVYVVAMSIKGKVIGVFEIGHGSNEACMADMKSIFTKLLLLNAPRFIIAHNHPSGDTTPSRDDINLTARTNKCAELLNIKLVDHVIIGGRDHCTSLLEVNPELFNPLND